MSAQCLNYRKIEQRRALDPQHRDSTKTKERDSMSGNEAVRRGVDEQRSLIRAIAGNIVSATDAGTAIRVLTEELEELKNTTGTERASDTFMRAICSHGALCSILCEFCNRVHFVGNGYGDYEEGELECLRASAAKEPSKYIEHNDYDSIDWGYINGKQIVWGCPCNSARQYEQWIWSHRYAIAKYLKLRAEEAQMDAKFAQEVADDANLIEEHAL